MKFAPEDLQTFRPSDLQTFRPLLDDLNAKILVILDKYPFESGLNLS
jgi:hypothetical protein